MSLVLGSEGGADSYTLTELHKIKEISDSSKVYTIKKLKQKLYKHYKELIFFAAVEGCSNIVCFKNMAKYIINEKCHSAKKANVENEVFY